jgi:hypothetical protein
MAIRHKLFAAPRAFARVRKITARGPMIRLLAGSGAELSASWEKGFVPIAAV